MKSLEGNFVVADENKITLTSYSDSGLVSTIPAGTSIHLAIGDRERSVRVSSVSGYDITVTQTIPLQMVGREGSYDLEITSNTPPTSS